MYKWEDRLVNKAKTTWENHKVLVLICLIIGPFTVQLGFNIINIISSIYDFPVKFPSPDSWIGFWGSYLGVIPAGLIAYFVATYQIENQKKIEREVQKNERNMSDLRSLREEFLKYRDFKNKLLAIILNLNMKLKEVDVSEIHELEHFNESFESEIESCIKILPEPLEEKFNICFKQFQETTKTFPNIIADLKNQVESTDTNSENLHMELTMIEQSDPSYSTLLDTVTDEIKKLNSNI